MRSLFLLLIAFAALSAQSLAAGQPDFAPFFKEKEGTFVLLDQQTGRFLYHNQPRARERFLPASTFKIPNSLIALETGVATGADFTLAWNREAAPPEPWWPKAWEQPEHTLRTAMANSVVWYYQELARRIGPERMQACVDRFRYGNRDISGGIDQFWLTGGLRISAEEQIDFLRRFYFEELGAPKAATQAVKEILLLEETPKYRLSGKTGLARTDPSVQGLGWFVGYLERDGKVSFFAMNLDVHSDADIAARRSITKAILQSLGLME